MESSFSLCSNEFGLEKLLFCAPPKDKTHINGTIMTAAEICGERPFLKLHQIRIKRNFSLPSPVRRLIIFCCRYFSKTVLTNINVGAIIITAKSVTMSTRTHKRKPRELQLSGFSFGILSDYFLSIHLQM
jgi:hypothetical protein